MDKQSRKSIADYLVYSRTNGKLLASGSAKECAAALGLAYGSFLTMHSRCKHGETVRYKIIRTNPVSKRQTKIPERIPYPCTGCMNHTYCMHSGDYCETFGKWFSVEYDIAVEKLRKACQSDGKDVN